MLQNVKTKVDLVALLKEINTLQFNEDGSKALMAFGPCTKVSELTGHTDLNEYPLLKQAILEIAKLREVNALYMMINRIPPGVCVPEHTDTLLEHPVFGKAPTLERFHLPILTNDKAEWWDEVTGKMNLLAGVWYGPVPYWVKHNVSNLGETERVHLVIDVDRQVTGITVPVVPLTINVPDPIIKPVVTKPIVPDKITLTSTAGVDVVSKPVDPKPTDVVTKPVDFTAR